MRITQVLAVALAAAALAGCVEGPTASTAGGDVRIALAPQFSFSGAAAGLPIEVVRVTPAFQPTGESAGGAARFSVSPADPSFEVYASIDMRGRDSATVVVLVEMLSVSSGAEIVEWSAVVGPIAVVAGRSAPTFDQPVAMVRGPIENLNVQSLSVAGPEYLLAGQTHDAWATVTAQGSYAVLWSSSDPSVATVDPLGDTVQVRGTGAGSAWIRGGAGLHADSFLVVVDTTTPGQPAFLFVNPQDSTVMTVGATRTFSAVVTDSAFIPLSATIAWQSLDGGVASVTSGGLVTALAIGRARIVASSGALADTVIVNVQSIPAGVDVMWIGGALGAEYDWFTADNWSPSRVPTGTDVVYVGANSYWPVLNGNTEVGGVLGDTIGWYPIQLENATLTVYGDVIGYFWGDSTSLVVIDAPTADLHGDFESLRILGAATLVGHVYVQGSLEVDGTARAAHLDLGIDKYAFVARDFTMRNATLIMGADAVSSSYLDVEGDFTVDGGSSNGTLTGGFISASGDFVVTAASCDAFVATGTEVQVYTDTSFISIGCTGPNSNRFSQLYLYPWGSSPVFELGSDIHVTDQLYLDGDNGGRIVGNGHTFFAQDGSAWWITLERAFMDVTAPTDAQAFYFDSVAFSGMAGETRPQLVYRHPGQVCDCFEWQDIAFDPSSSGPYIHAIDTNPTDGLPLRLYNAKNPGDGPARTVVDGATVYWAGIPYYLLYWSGSGQSGTQYQPLADSLVAQVVDYAFEPVPGIQVNWAVVQGSGSVSPASGSTDAAGLVATMLTVGDTMDITNVVAATASFTPDTIFYYAYPTPVGGQGTPAAAPGAAESGRAAEPTAREATRRRAPELRPLDRPGHTPAREPRIREEELR